MQFNYKAINASGETIEGSAEAEDKFDLARVLKAQNETLISAEEASKKSPLARFNISIGGVKLSEKIAFAKNLAAMIDAGLSISRGLDVMQRQTKDKKFKGILTDIAENVQKGSSLAEAFGKHVKTFSPLFVSMVRAGEESGNLSESLRVTSNQMDRSYKLKRKIKGAMMYPSIVVGAMIIIGILMMMFVVPTLTQTFVELNVDLPASTQFIIAVSDLLKNQPLLTFGVLIVFVVLVVLLLRTKKGKRGFEWLIMHLPVIGPLVKQTNAARMAHTLSSLLVSGVEVISAFEITKDVMQNSYYKEVMEEAGEVIQQGQQFSDVLVAHESLYPPMVVDMVSVGEETGKLPDMLLQIAEFFEEEVQEKTKDLSTIIEPILMIVIGVFVGFFAVSMITPIYSISSGI